MIAALVIAACLAADPPPGVTRVMSPEDAMRAAVADLATLPADRQLLVRYVWVPPWLGEDAHHVVSYAVNLAASRSGTIQHPTLVAGGTLQRWDLDRLVPDPTVRASVGEVWDTIASSDPYFRRDGVSHPVPGLLVSVPLVRADRFAAQCLLAIDGRYPELRGLTNLRDDSGRTEEEIALARFGVFRSTSIEVDGDRRVGMVRSEVTGKARAVLALRGLVGSAWITEDLLDEDTDASRHPIYHLLDGRPRGHEIIWELPNGLHGFLITDGDGRVLREAPPDLVTDHRTPAPHTSRLDGGAFSCIRCHGQSRGLRDCRNDVAAILATDVRILGDGSRTPEQAAEEIATRYAGRDFERLLERGRLDYDAAIDELTGGTHDAETLAAATAELIGSWKYPLVDSRRVCLELGFEVAEGTDATAVLRELLPTPVPSPGVAITEDPTIALLAAGVPIGRVDLERIYGELLIRSASWRP